VSTPHIIVIGGGAAGFFAAITAAEAGARVTILEKTARFLDKVRISGGGRCNVTHTDLDAREFAGADAFLHMVGDHLYVSAGTEPSTHRLVALAEAAECSVSGVQPTRESLLPRFGTVAGRRVEGRSDLYRIDTVIEKPTPTEAEQRLMVPGIRAGYYLCFFGIHVLTPAVMALLEKGAPTLSAALAELARHEQYLALEDEGRRYDLGARYGLLVAQLALALNGQDRAQVLSQMLELLADRELRAAAGGTRQ